MRLISIGLIMTVLASGTSEALANRFYCAVEDGDIKMALESDYRENQGQALRHFRGIVMVKDAAAPPLLKDLKLTSGMLTQSWLDDRSLRLRVYAEKEAWRSFVTLELTMEAGTSGQEPSAGRYTMSVEWAKNRGAERKAARYAGTLRCKYE